jgi:hypothetical protein
MKKSVFIGIMLFIVFGYLVSAESKESTTITCYVGDPYNNKHLGSVEVFNISNAPNVCNHVFYDCDGRCTGCYIDEDSQQVCIDSTGYSYIKQ